MQYHGASYAEDKWDVFWYEKNIFGDIVAVYDATGTKFMSYRYDAFGNCIRIAHAYNDAAYNNPFGYRGYYYDIDLGLYYLNSRYYDGYTGRFISADSVVAGIGGNIKGYNLFAYCFNNPVNSVDPNGNWPQWIKDAVKWTAKNIVRPVVKAIEASLSEVDATYSIGVNVSFSTGGFVFNIQAGMSVDTEGNVAIQGTFGGGFTTGSPSISATVYRTVTNAPNIGKLNGTGYQIGGSVGVPLYGVPLVAGGDFNIIPDSDLNTTYFGATTNAGFGTPGREFYAGWGETGTWDESQFNIFGAGRNAYTKIMGW